MNIGILTFHMVDNYGAVLQCYALQQFLSSLYKCNVEVIDFSPQAEKDYYKILKRKHTNPLKNLFLQVETLLHYRSLVKKRSSFEAFRRKFLNISAEHYETQEEVFQKLKPYDYYVVGSDQVFNPFGQYCNVYLNFDKKNGKKIAYAPSFGISEFDNVINQEHIKGLLSFDRLSCREKQGADLMQKVTGNPIPTIIDPVFLLSREEWLKIAIEPEVSEDYILVYNLNGGNKLLKIVEEINAVYGLKVVCITSNTRLKFKGCDFKYGVGPLELLGYINNAKLILTDSFHGTALSAVLARPFYSFIALQKTSSRIQSLLSTIGGQDRIITPDSPKEYNIDINPALISNIEKEKLNAIKYLKSVFSISQ